jgi:hypothetical protein
MAFDREKTKHAAAELAANGIFVGTSSWKYLKKEGNAAGRAEFIGILEAHLGDRGFCSDMDQLLRTGANYDPQKAGEYVKANLLKLLPD